MNFDYNSTRPKLILAEYGRNVQNMVNYICDLPTKEERNKYAQVVIDMMGVLNPHLRDVADFKHKLWDHLQIISDFQIDVDSPYPKATPELVKHEPELLSYPQHNIKYKHYGFTVEKMINKAISITDEEKRQKMALSIANFMKMAYTTWNKDAVADEFIIQDLAELSSKVLQLPEGTVLTKQDFKSAPPGNRVKGNNPIQTTNNNSGHSNNNHSRSNNNNNSNNRRPSGTNSFQKRSNSGGGSSNNNNRRPYQNNNNSNNNNSNSNSGYKRG
ncbi:MULTISPECIES: DUF4290 domain-containing protein [unclassified Sphingobacterium]|uniref:DUF4290 domain-containing protein n=1 Tax=unclassified Sphingobacterium TaxID=2609468 RepID=UPI001045A653|nr:MULTISPECIES: DUF4290 domain-containing protein [unclassified Sphingobacterium]MCS3554030.1 hypothetical protein [Sphingobacterium sp. JUb21]TCR05349.1 uncharacterized protein DUF4290 [Sphingobacterium sp. JUb20]